MRFYTKEHRHYCGIDLHARSMYLCILTRDGEIVLHRDMRADPESFLSAIAPYRDDLVVSVECIFTWYWIADLCAHENIPFVLGHALYMKAIHGGKTKNDRIDSRKIAGLLRSGMIPMAYVYPARMRATRDLLRRRGHFVRKRGDLLAHIQNTLSQYNLPEFGKKLTHKVNFESILERFQDPEVRRSIAVNLELIEHYNRIITNLERYCQCRFNLSPFCRIECPLFIILLFSGRRRCRQPQRQAVPVNPPLVRGVGRAFRPCVFL